jgi:hypothetical protein
MGLVHHSIDNFLELLCAGQALSVTIIQCGGYNTGGVSGIGIGIGTPWEIYGIIRSEVEDNDASGNGENNGCAGTFGACAGYWVSTIYPITAQGHLAVELAARSDLCRALFDGSIAARSRATSFHY